jgi:hypothetical protein
MKRSILRLLWTAVCAALLLVGAGAARAVDGVLEINDASIVAAGGYPAVIAAPGSYVLTGNLTPPAGSNGIDVIAADVTLDLNGFQIFGAGAPLSVGINGLSIGLTVRNGAVTGFDTGISAGASSKVFQVRVMGNTGTGISGSTCLILESTIEANGFGVAAQRCKIENNVIVGSAFSGISGMGNLILHNQIIGNIGGGIFSFGESNITENVINGNGTYGISDGILAPPPPPTPPPLMPKMVIRGNSISGNGGPGVSFEIPVLISDNSISGNMGSGVDCGAACTLNGNQIDTNNTALLPASGGAVVGDGSNVTDNSISFNTGFGLMLTPLSGYSQNTFNANGPLDVINLPPGPHPTSGFMNLCTGLPGPSPSCP